MDQEKIIIDADDILLEWDDKKLIRFPLIVDSPTGIFYTAQVGGIRCAHPEVEGFFIELRFDSSFDQEIEKFNDCSYGCWLTPDYKSHDEHRQKYAKAINKFLIEKVNPSNLQEFKLNFDNERVNELTEGWWPVTIQIGSYSREFKGYLHLGNCD